MRDNGPAIDLPGFHRTDDRADLLQGGKAEVDAFGCRHHCAHLVERRTGLRNGEFIVVQILERFDSRLVRGVGDQELPAVYARFFLQRAADDFDGAPCRQG